MFDWGHPCAVLAVYLGSLATELSIEPSVLYEVISALEQILIKNISVLRSVKLSFNKVH